MQNKRQMDFSTRLGFMLHSHASKYHRSQNTQRHTLSIQSRSNKPLNYMLGRQFWRPVWTLTAPIILPKHSSTGYKTYHLTRYRSKHIYIKPSRWLWSSSFQRDRCLPLMYQHYEHFKPDMPQREEGISLHAILPTNHRHQQTMAKHHQLNWSETVMDSHQLAREF